jgi:hypothetical protein
MREIMDIPVGALMSTTVVAVTPETSVEGADGPDDPTDYNGFPVVTDQKARRARHAHGPLQGLSVGGGRITSHCGPPGIKPP